MVPHIFNGIQPCCIESRCMRNFQGIPLRFCNPDVIPYQQLLNDKEKYCCICGYPDKTPEVLEVLEDLQEDEANEVSDMGFRAVFPGDRGNNRDIQTFWQRRHRVLSHRIMGGYRSIRRNILNIIMWIPSKNCYLVNHQTYRFLPARINPDVFLDRILRETMALIREEYFQDIPEFFCQCSN